MLKKPLIMAMIIILFTLFIAFNIPIEKRKYGLSSTSLTTDYTGLLPEKIERVVEANSREQLQEIVQQANVNGQHLSIAGLQHSQGGHTYYKDGIVLDMRSFKKILEVDVAAKTVHVEAGATWEDVQQAIAPHGLALQVTQSQSIFTVGGSLSINAHGRDIRFGPMASTVRALTLLTPTGEIEQLTREQDADKLANILGGYGLFGVILDVTLDLTDNEMYIIETAEVKVEDYRSYMKDLLVNEQTAMHYARISVAPKSFMQEMYIINYHATGTIETNEALKGEQGMRLSKLALDFGRQGGMFEDLFWKTQQWYIHSLHSEMISRNNVMRSESTFMEFTKPGKVEVLQEFFVPVDAFEEYIADLRTLLPANDRGQDIKIHNITVRYVEKDDDTNLNYAREDMLGLVVLMQHGTDEESIADAKMMIQQWTDVTLARGGTYYLPYYPYQTQAQFEKSYPKADEFTAAKKIADPNEVFVNIFYDNYIKEGASSAQ